MIFDTKIHNFIDIYIIMVLKLEDSSKKTEAVY